MTLHIEFKMDKIRFAKFIRYMFTRDGEAILTKHLSKATHRNGLEVVKLMRKAIKSGDFAKNADLTVALKKSSKPLVDSGTLFKAITAQRLSDLEVFVGILRTDKAYNVAKNLHDGIAIKVSKKMRGMFFLLHKASIDEKVIKKLRGRAKELWDLKPGNWKPLKDSTTKIIIPPRPFVTMTMKDPELINILKKNWNHGLDQAFKEIKQRVG